MGVHFRARSPICPVPVYAATFLEPRGIEQPEPILAERRRLGLPNCTHETGWNIKLPRRPESPRRGEGLARQAPKRLIGERDTVRVVGVASERGFAVLHPQTSYSDSHIKQRAAVLFDQRPFLSLLAFEKYHEVGVHLLGDRKRRLAAGEPVRNRHELERALLRQE